MNNENLKPFTKNDKRINRNGRPKSFDQLRKLAQRIAAEDISPAEAAEAITRVEAMLKTMSSSRNPADKALFLAYAYGKPKDEVDVTSGGEKITNTQEIYDSIVRKLGLTESAETPKTE